MQTRDYYQRLYCVYNVILLHRRICVYAGFPSRTLRSLGIIIMHRETLQFSNLGSYTVITDGLVNGL